MRIPLILATSLFISAGCGPRDLSDDPDNPDNPTSGSFGLTVSYPERGTIYEGVSVLVSGNLDNATPEDAQVEVNGMVATLGGDGNFERSLPTPPGLTLITTTAQRGNGDPITDTRAILAGEFAPEGSVVRDAIVAHVGDATIRTLGEVLADVAEQTHIGALAAPYNPVLSRGGSCLGVDADLLDVTFSDMEIELQSTEGGLSATVVAHGLVADLHADYRVACIGASSPVQITADSLTVTGMIGLSVENGEIAADLRGAQATFDNFDLTVGSLPSSIIEFFVDVDEMVATAIVDTLADVVPTAAQTFFADFSSGEITLPIAGRGLWLHTRLVEGTFGFGGGTLVLEGQARIDDGVDGDYVRTPAPRPTAGQFADSAGLSVALADDIVNQVLTAYWASGGLHLTLPVEPGSAIANTLGDQVAQVIVEPLLPPMVSTNASAPDARLTVGDVMVDFRNASGALLARLALSGHVDLGAELTAQGGIAITVGTPTLSINILEDGGLFLLEPQLEAMMSFAVSDLIGGLNLALQAVPIPSFGETSISAPSLTSVDGFLLVSGNLSR